MAKQEAQDPKIEGAKAETPVKAPEKKRQVIPSLPKTASEGQDYTVSVTLSDGTNVKRTVRASNPTEAVALARTQKE